MDSLLSKKKKTTLAEIRASPETNKYPMYVKDPVLNDAMIKYVTYTLAGRSINQDHLIRRFSDFFALREKLVERWPGIFIPSIPPKKAVGNLEPKNVDHRMRKLNDFCYKLSHYSFLMNSEEVQMFQTATGDCGKAITALPKLSYTDILQKYQSTFTNYYENYDIILGKGKMIELSSFLKRALKNIKAFKETVTTAYSRSEDEIERYISMMKSIQEYETKTLAEYVEDSNKLIFTNGDKSDIIDRMSALDTTLLNPYKYLVDWIESEEMDLEAMLETLDGLTGLNTTMEKLQQKIDNIDRDLKNGTYEKKGFMKIFSSEKNSKEGLENQKQKCEEDIEALKMILKIAHCNMECEFGHFKEEKVKMYHKNIKLFAITQKGNNKFLEDLWKDIKTNLNLIRGGQQQC